MTANTISDRTIDMTRSDMAIPFQFRAFAFEPTSSYWMNKMQVLNDEMSNFPDACKSITFIFIWV